MRKIFGFVLIPLATVLLITAGGGGWYVKSKLPQRSGELALAGLTASVTVRYDERGVPHIRAENEVDLYRALGYVHAQDRLFQMEVLRRLARGELAEILGPKLLETDQLFRTIGIRSKADQMAAGMDRNAAPGRTLLAYLEGVNEYQRSRPAPMEFDVLGIPKRPFTAADAFSVAGYLAYSFAAAFRTEPAMTYVRDKLGSDYLKVFDLDWHPEGVIQFAAARPELPSRQLARMKPQPNSQPLGVQLDAPAWRQLARLAAVSDQAHALAAVPMFEGSNAWVVSGKNTVSGKPLLAGDPHMGFAVPSVWYEAHLSAPGFELYGHFLALIPSALLGHNRAFGWSLTMFLNDDMDLVAEKINPANPNQVWHQGQWVELRSRQETIAVKGAAPVPLTLHQSPHGPIVSSAFGDKLGAAPVSMWWAFLETDNPAMDGFYELNRADTLAKARAAVSRIHAPGLNIVWANASGDIGWWAGAKLPQRPKGVNPVFILDASKGEADKPGFHPFSANPQEENPVRGYIMSANHQPQSASGIEVPGYYSQFDRARRIDELLRQAGKPWDVNNIQALQLDTRTAYGPRTLAPLLSELDALVTDPAQRSALAQLARWDGDYQVDSLAPTLFVQFLYELALAAMADEMGQPQFDNLLSTRALDLALPRLTADATSPWWDNRATPAVETRRNVVKLAWDAAWKHLNTTLGQDQAGWAWGKAHTLTHGHALGRQKPLDKLFNVGPFEVPGGRETPNNMYISRALGPVPWQVTSGPSTRRLIDFAQPERALGINPVGQSGVLFDAHYSDQASPFARGLYMPQHLAEKDIAAHTRSTLTLKPKQP